MTKTHSDSHKVPVKTMLDNAPVTSGSFVPSIPNPVKSPSSFFPPIPSNQDFMSLKDKEILLSPYNQAEGPVTSGEYQSIFQRMLAATNSRKQSWSSRMLKTAKSPLVTFSISIVFGTLTAVFGLNAAIVYNKEQQIESLLQARSRLRQQKQDLLEKISQENVVS